MSSKDHLRELVAEVAAAYFRNGHVSASEIPDVISQIASSLGTLSDRNPAVRNASSEGAGVGIRPAPPSQVRNSISYDALISFEDHKPYKNLRPHLAARGLTPEAYRAKWGLPPDYPMVAASYSEARSRIAKSMRLGARGVAARKQLRSRRSGGASGEGRGR